MRFRVEVLPFLFAALGLGVIVGVPVAMAGAWIAAGIWSAVIAVLCGYLLYFFRDPPRVSPAIPGVILAPADGVIARVLRTHEDTHLRQEVIRVSTFLSLLDVHVNRTPFAGNVRFLAYYPGKRHFTFLEKSSLYNQHSAVVIDGEIPALMHQIVGPVARRVVYWPKVGDPLAAGAPFGMMKFGSRLDIYLPADAVEILAQEGDRVRAGETVIARIIGPSAPAPR